MPSNSKGQVFFLGLMLGIAIIIMALALAPALKEIIDDGRNPDNLDCGNSSISTFDQATCIVTDVSLFSFIVGLIFIAGAIIGARIIFSE